MSCGNITLKRKLGEYSVGMSREGIFAVRYSLIIGGNRLEICHSGNYFFARYGRENEMKKAERDSWYAEFFQRIREMIEQPPVLSGVEISSGECLLAHLKNKQVENPGDVALIGLLCKKKRISAKVNIWGEAYRFIPPNSLDRSNSKDA